MSQPTPSTLVVPQAVDDTIDIQDFTIHQKRVRFRVDSDIFEASTILGIATMQSLVSLSKNLSDMVEKQEYQKIQDVFAELLIPESAKVFNARLMKKGDESIDVQRQLIPILHWLMEKFGVRPTQPSSVSSTGSPSGTDGTTSTDGS